MTATGETTMRERPILFSAAMVRAILAGTKTQTRRVMKPQPYLCLSAEEWRVRALSGVDSYMRPIGSAVREDLVSACPYGQPGDRLWVRETWADVNSESGPGIAYKADGEFWQPDFDGEDFGAGPSFNYEKYPGTYANWYSDLIHGLEGRWRPSIHMPRWASRITLEVTGVRVERLQDISEADARAEGVAPNEFERTHDNWGGVLFRRLWESINGPGSWDANPWVWVVEFARVPA